MKKIKNSKRGLTFATEDTSKIGTKFRYVIDKKNNEILIIEDENGKGTVSRKKSGSKYKPLYDIRSKEVKDIVSEADYLEIEIANDKIIVHVLKAVKKAFKAFKSNLVRIEDILAVKSGEIVINKAVGGSEPQFWFGQPTLANDEYFSYLISQNQSYFKKQKPDVKDIKTVYDVVSLFSGAGLLDNAFKDPKFRFVYAVDFDKEACQTYKENMGDHIHCMDIRDVIAKDIPNADLVIGGPCCQGYSNANRSNEDSEVALAKRLLIDDYVRIVKEKQPKVFVIENVPQLLTKDDGMYISRVLDGLPEYEITCKVIKDDEVGGYTIRKRAIVIGSRIGKIELPDIQFTTVKTVRDALSKVDSTWFNYSDVTLPRDDTKLTMSYVPQGGNWQDVPPSIHKFGPSTQSAVYRRLAWNEVSPTIANWRKSIIIHPDEDRILTVSEAAALMGLEKDFKFLGSLNAKQQQVANGVTQAIGKFVKKYVLDALDSSNRIIKLA